MPNPPASRETIREAIARGLSALVGPAASELGEAIADRVRFFRWQSAVRILQRAEEFARERGVRPKEIPLGFLVPFLEKASLTEPDSELLDQWANLLVSGMLDFESELVPYVQILSELTPRGARILKYLMNRSRTRRTKLVHPESIDELELSQIFVGGFKVSDVDSSFAKLSAAFQMTGFALQSMSAEIAGDVYHWDSELETDVITNEGYNSLYLLERQKLVERLEVQWTHEADYDFRLAGLRVTPLGFDFYCRCNGRSSNRWVPDNHKDAKLRRRKRGKRSR